MRKLSSVLFWITVGAVASGAGIGYFLYRANDDRRALAVEAESAKRQADEAASISQRIAEEANQKLRDASDEIAKARQVLLRLEEQQRTIRQAVPLPPPSKYVLRKWEEKFSIPLSLSLRLPPETKTLETERAFVALAPGTAESGDQQWLSITPYDETEEQSILLELNNAQPLTYFTNGRLLVGSRGSYGDVPGTVYLFRLQATASANSTHLIWARTAGAINEEKILNTLATIELPS